MASQISHSGSECECLGFDDPATRELSPSDLGYLRLAELLLTGRDRRPLPEDEKVDFLVS